MNTTTLFHKTIGDGADLVLIHGWGFNHRIWNPIVFALSEFCRVTVVDLPGFGNSHFEADYHDMETILADVMAVTPNHASYLGWSFGGLINFAIATQFPTHVKSLIFVNSAPRLRADHDWPGTSSLVLQNFMNELNLNHQQSWKQFLIRKIRDAKLPISIRKQIQAHITENLPHKKTLLSSMEFLINADFRDGLIQMNVPQHYFFGDQDQTIPIHTANAILQNNKNSNIQIIENAGHISFLSQPQIFVKKIRQILI